MEDGELFSTAVNAIVPGDAEGAGLDGDFDGVAIVKAIEVVGVDGQALEMLARTPGTYEQAAAAVHDAFHVEAALHHVRIVGDVFRRIEAAVDKQGGR
jgi:hypothetical protein